MHTYYGLEKPAFRCEGTISTDNGPFAEYCVVVSIRCKPLIRDFIRKKEVKDYD